MANLFSQYASGTQFTAGTIVGSALGISGLNPIIDRLNSITTDNGLVIGSIISGTATTLVVSGITTKNFSGTSNFSNLWQTNNIFTGSVLSGTTTQYNGSAGFVWGDHPLGSNFRLINVILGTGSLTEMNASGCPIGTLYLQYTA